jgi:hypothetical protein
MSAHEAAELMIDVARILEQIQPGIACHVDVVPSRYCRGAELRLVIPHMRSSTPLPDANEW